MGSTIWVEAYNRPLKDTADDCSKSHCLINQLDRIAAKLGVAKLSDFYDWTEMALLASDAETRAIEAIQRREEPEPSYRNLTGQSLAERQSNGKWFEPTMALTAVRTLKEHIARHPTELVLDTDPGDVARYAAELMDELNLLDQILQQVLAEGQGFRFLIVP